VNNEPKRELTFLSYAHDDLERVRKVYEGLKKRKVDVWFDKKDVTKGKWKPQINQAIANSKHFIVCLSDTAISKMQAGKGVQKDEFSYAFNLAMNLPDDALYILPVRLEDCDRGDRRFQMYQQYDLFENFEKGLDTLAVDLGGYSLSDVNAMDERTEEEKVVAGLLGKGDMFYYSGEFDNALPFYEAATQIKPDNYLAWTRKGVSLSKLGRHDDAMEATNKAIDIKPDSYEAWSNKGGIILNCLGRHEESLEACNKAIEIKPDYHKAWHNKGSALGNLGRYDEALEAFNKAIEIKPDYAYAWFNKARALRKLGRHIEAFKAIWRSVRYESERYRKK
jgi:tetratricopeptide (TPR) repeat protein